MRLRKNFFPICLPLTVFLLFACVTINIYFPAEKVENVAEDIVDDIRGTDNKKNPQSQKGTKPLSRLMEIFGFLGPASAHAQDVTEVSNATIRALKENMRQRYPQIKPLYVKGLIKEGDNGYLVEGNLRQVDLKTRRQVKKLMDAENSDRTKLYKEVAVALKIDPSQINRVEEIFAKQWQKSVP